LFDTIFYQLHDGRNRFYTTNWIMQEIKLNDIKTVYFIGIGGIGMSALARYFLLRGCIVHGYDKTETELTKQLAKEGMVIHYTDDISFISDAVDLVIYTPAVPKHHSELVYFQQNGFPVLKRSEVLGIISRGMKCIGVAGTHGKTTTSSIVTHILRAGGVDVTAFLGGISLSIGSNFMEGKSDWVVVEADEFDRSFLRLSPDMAIVTAIDPDHLDIYGDEANFIKGFEDYADRLKDGGKMFKQVQLLDFQQNNASKLRGIEWSTYGVDKGNYCSVNLRVEEGFFVFDYKSEIENIDNIKFSLPGRHNVENATAAIAVAQQLGVKPEAIKEALLHFKGIKRRFDFVIRPQNTEGVVFIDDYAHHPTELESAIAAARALYPNRHLTGIFQPHLYTRTRDFQDAFASALDKLDAIILMDIYPARELPIEGVTSEILFYKMKNPHKTLVTKSNLMEILRGQTLDVLMTLGAGDIDTFVKPIKDMLETK
jgi:UDP-N-acetylmuramate--alanine ligase